MITRRKFSHEQPANTPTEVKVEHMAVACYYWNRCRTAGGTAGTLPTYMFIKPLMPCL